MACKKETWCNMAYLESYQRSPTTKQIISATIRSGDDLYNVPEEQLKNLRETIKALNRKERSRELVARKALLEKNLRVGAYLKNEWGCTMKRVNYVQIVSIEGKRIGIAPAQIDGNPSPCAGSATCTLIGPATSNIPTKYLYKLRGYLVTEGQKLSRGWNTWSFCDLGDSTCTFSD